MPKCDAPWRGGRATEALRCQGRSQRGAADGSARVPPNIPRTSVQRSHLVHPRRSWGTKMRPKR
eukprot:1312035-Amphidinium_carterae.1